MDDIEQVSQESQLDQGALWRATHFKVHTKSDSIKNNEPEKFREWKWFTKDELITIYDDIYEVDKLVVDMYL
jgi:predicted NUDIX family phosphoesterase